MSRSKLDPSHIIQLTYDEVSEATKVKLTDAEIAIELDANDGDSVTSHPAKLTASAIGCDAGDNGTDVIPAQDCSSLTEIRVDVDGTGDVDILVSPTDSGDFFYSIGMQGGIYKICARRIKIKSNDAIGDVHLVGRS